MNIKCIRKLVEKCLIENEETRNSDWKLYVAVCKNMGLSEQSTIQEIASNTKSFPSFESVSRCRRKFQEVGLYEAKAGVKLERKFNENTFRQEFA